MNFRAFKKLIEPFPLFSLSLLENLPGATKTLRVQLSLWKKKGWIDSLRRGLYILGREERKQKPSLFFLANQIYIPSYVSLESALSFHGLIPEYVPTITSISVRKTIQFKNELGLFIYQHISSKAFDGFEIVKESQNLTSLMATPEKAIVDFIYLNLKHFKLNKPSIFEESYRFQYCESLKPKYLRLYANKFESLKLTAVIELFITEMISNKKHLKRKT